MTMSHAAPGVAPDADDTSKAIKLLSMTGSSTSPKAMVDYFKANDHFRTYRSERNASFSANCNVLGCLLSADDPNMYTSQIEKATRFLCTSFWGADDRIIDKWVPLLIPVMRVLRLTDGRRIYRRNTQ